MQVLKFMIEKQYTDFDYALVVKLESFIQMMEVSNASLLAALHCDGILSVTVLNLSPRVTTRWTKVIAHVLGLPANAGTGTISFTGPLG